VAARKPRPQSLCHVGTLDQSKPTASARLARQHLSRVEHEFGRLSTNTGWHHSASAVLTGWRLRGSKQLLKTVTTVNITPNPDGSWLPWVNTPVNTPGEQDHARSSRRLLVRNRAGKSQTRSRRRGRQAQTPGQLWGAQTRSGVQITCFVMCDRIYATPTGPASRSVLAHREPRAGHQPLLPSHRTLRRSRS
jgi:hypothetical protein